MNEERERTTFQSRRGSINTDLTVINNRLFKISMTGKSVKTKAVYHNTIKFKLGHETKQVTQHNHHGLRYIIQENTTTDSTNI